MPHPFHFIPWHPFCYGPPVPNQRGTPPPPDPLFPPHSVYMGRVAIPAEKPVTMVTPPANIVMTVSTISPTTVPKTASGGDSEAAPARRQNAGVYEDERVSDSENIQDFLRDLVLKMADRAQAIAPLPPHHRNYDLTEVKLSAAEESRLDALISEVAFGIVPEANVDAAVGEGTPVTSVNARDEFLGSFV